MARKLFERERYLKNWQQKIQVQITLTLTEYNIMVDATATENF